MELPNIFVLQFFSVFVSKKKGFFFSFSFLFWWKIINSVVLLITFLSFPISFFRVDYGQVVGEKKVKISVWFVPYIFLIIVILLWCNILSPLGFWVLGSLEAVKCLLMWSVFELFRWFLGFGHLGCWIFYYLPREGIVYPRVSTLHLGYPKSIPRVYQAVVG